MTAQSTTGNSPLARAQGLEVPTFYQEGIIAGTLGAATVAAWFFLLDLVNGHPLYTPSILGTALFHGLRGLADGSEIPVSFEMVLVFSWIHLLVFALLGVAAARLLAFAERDPNLGFGLILLFVVFEFAFVVVSMVAAEGVLQALTVPAILFGNLLAAAAMGGYFWRRHPHLAIRP